MNDANTYTITEWKSTEVWIRQCTAATCDAPSSDTSAVRRPLSVWPAFATITFNRNVPRGPAVQPRIEVESGRGVPGLG